MAITIKQDLHLNDGAKIPQCPNCGESLNWMKSDLLICLFCFENLPSIELLSLFPESRINYYESCRYCC